MGRDDAKLEPVESDAISGVAYQPDDRMLTVRYRSGAVYEYYDVDPSLFETLEESQPHPWTTVGEDVKAHRFRRVR